TEPVYVRKLWLGLGIPPERMIFEEKSRNTWENALFTWNLLKPKPGDRFILVTSASHMPRSVGIFRKVGFDVTPYPSDYRTAGDSRDWTVFLPAEDRLITLDLSLREWIGLVAYWFTGKTTALFPAP
ncbi:MAG TPA: YdcF family protein, partial [Beijerinckia sp.]|nr:YdcF family protein [Beijerinckia sp.]